MEDRCVCCGEIIPEGRQICWKCENATTKYESWYILPARQCGKINLMRKMIEEWKKLNESKN